MSRWGALGVFLSAVLVLIAGPAGSTPSGDPKPQEPFREFIFNHAARPGTHFSELDPDTKRDFSKQHTWAAKKPRKVPQPIELDIRHATRAELSVEYWGGHIGTSGQRFSVNDNAWRDLPQPAGTPGKPQHYYRTLLGNNAVAVPLKELKQGKNHIRFAAGPQIKYSFDFGFYWVYAFTVRVYYDPAWVAPPRGEIALKRGATLGENPEIGITAATPLARVDVFAECDDFDWDGNGVWREWQFQTRYGVPHHHVGTALKEPWRVKWDTRWLQDQSRPIRLVARLTDKHGVSAMTPIVEGVRFNRTGRRVTAHRAEDVPERFGVRAGKRMSCTIVLPKKLDGVRAARLVVSTWSGSTDKECRHELAVNGKRLANRFGKFHDYSFDVLEVPVERLKPGKNEIAIASEYDGHALEINWPGPLLLLEWKQP